MSDMAAATDYAYREGVRSAAARGSAPTAHGEKARQSEGTRASSCSRGRRRLFSGTEDGPVGRGPNDRHNLSLQSPRILGIDPGIGICGFGVIEGTRAIDFGVIATPPHTPLVERLEDIYNSLHEIIDQNHPDVVSIEKLYFVQNITTGIEVAEARGVCLLVAHQHHLPIFEYTPNQIKKAICGYGQAHKPQIQEMVRVHLGLAEVPQPDDAADGLAAAIVHSLAAKTRIAS